MIISLVRLPADGRRFEHRYEAGELDLGAHEFRLAAAPEVSGRVDRTGMDLRLRGQLRARLLAPCDRCLSDASFEVDAPFDLFYAPLPADVEAGSETELQERDLGFSFYDGDSIDLDEMVVEQLALALPTRVLCRSDCRGLCDQCGADLNSETCRCAKPMDPRWQALADLRADDRGADTNPDAPREDREVTEEK